MKRKNLWQSIILIIVFLSLLGCNAPTMLKITPQPETPLVPIASFTPEKKSQPDAPAIATEPPSPTPLPPEQPVLPPVKYGPNLEDFPENINPLTGLPVSDPAQLREPALLISIPHFPASARPQAGISYAPWVFEYLIAEGTTRFLATFYGQIPYQETPALGDCEVRAEPFAQEDIILGNFIWLDSNGNGVQDIDERGVGGVCVKLYDDEGNFLEESSSDSNGYYGFNVSAGMRYQVEFVQPPEMKFTLQDEGYENLDSDADPVTGRTPILSVSTDERHLDVGLLPSQNLSPEEEERLEPAFGNRIGPIRSARLVYIPIHDFFRYSCLIFAGATWEIIDEIPYCALVYGDDGTGGFLEIERMERISEENAFRRGSDFSYASNLFAETPPAGGEQAAQLDIFTSLMNQSKWMYDPLHQGWLRYVDNLSEEPEFHPEIDPLTGRELVFQNVILIEVKHEVLMPRIIEMSLEQGLMGEATLFRDGQKYDIRWSTLATEYEQKTGLRSPLHFVDKDNNPVALRPGKTWIFIITPYSVLSESAPSLWNLRVYSPAGAGEY